MNNLSKGKKIKRIISILLCFCFLIQILFPVIANIEINTISYATELKQGDHFDQGNVRYTFDGTKTLYAEIINKNIEKVEIIDGAKLGNNLYCTVGRFDTNINDTKIEDITIPIYLINKGILKNTKNIKKVTIIGKGNSVINSGVFDGCTNLEYVKMTGVQKIADSVFKNKKQLKEVTTDNYLNVIGVSAFEGCSNMKRLIFSYPANNIKIIGNYAFYNCTNLESAASGTNGICGSNLETIGKNAFTNCEKFYEFLFFNKSLKLKKIGEAAFYNTGVEHVHFEESNITNIGQYAFASCKNLRYVTFNDKITKIEDYAFYNCNSSGTPQNSNKGLWVIPQNVNNIGEHAFENCKDTNFRIPCSVIKIGDYAFDNINGLIYCANNSYASEYLTKKGKKILKYDEDHIKISGALDFELKSANGNRTATLVSWNSSLSNWINIPKTINVKGNNYTITEIGMEAFKNSTVTSVVIPETVTMINSGAFKNCAKLSKIVIPKNVVHIFGDIFEGANKNITIFGDANSEIEKIAKKYGRENNFVSNGSTKIKQIEQENTTVAQAKENIQINSNTSQVNNTQTAQVSKNINTQNQTTTVAKDTSKPIASNMKISVTSGWCKQNKVTFDLKDNSYLSYVRIYLGKEIVYQYDKFGNSTSYNITYYATKNGKYIIYASDKKGNYGEVGWFNIQNIDNIKPTVQCQVSPMNTWSLNKNVSITISDNLGLASYEIYYNNKIVKKDEFSDSRKTHKINYIAENNGKYIIKVYDVMGLGGNIGKFTINSIDNIKPQISNYSLSSQSGWCTQNTCKFNISDNLGIKSYKITYNGIIMQAKEYNNSPKSDQISYTARKNGMYKIFVEDIKGLNSEMGWFRIGNIDDKAPTISNFVLSPNVNTKSKSKTITMTLSDVGFGVEKYILTEKKAEIKDKSKYKNLTSDVYNNSTKKLNY